MTRRVSIPNSADLKRQLLDRAQQVLNDEEMRTVFGDDITLPTIVIDADPTDDIEVITIDPVVFDTDTRDE